MGNTLAYVLDPERRPVPIGVHGELHLGGPKVTRGYIGRPDLTSAAFVHLPEVCRAGRLYKTGDRARWLGDGNLEFLGRMDHQVKLNGLRIELGEIEAALRRHGSVSDAAVLVRPTPAGAKQLVGYVVPAQALVEGALGECAACLPTYMVPALCVALEEWPTTSSGKLDRKALPDPDWSNRGKHREAYVAPRSQAEAAVAAIWSEVLGVGRAEVGARGDFFALGGTSLAAVRCATRMRRELGAKVTAADLMAARSVEAAAAAVLVAAPGISGASMGDMEDAGPALAARVQQVSGTQGAAMSCWCCRTRRSRCGCCTSWRACRGRTTCPRSCGCAARCAQRPWWVR